MPDEPRMTEAEVFWRELTKDMRPYVQGGTGMYDTRRIDKGLADANRPVPDWIRIRDDSTDPLGTRYEFAWIKSVESCQT
jgi:hypothetical protein